METHRAKDKTAFTLIELLVVLAIISILISILLPAMRLARTQARNAVCLSNQHQLVMSCLMYLEEHGRIPNPWAEPGYPSSIVRFQFFGVEQWSYSAPARGDLGLTYNYHHNLDVQFCPDWESDRELIQAGAIWPGTETGLSYSFNTLTRHYFADPAGGWYSGSGPGHEIRRPEELAEPSATLWFMDGADGYAGNYIEPPTWPSVYNYWPGVAPGAMWWETHRPSQRHMGNFNSSFLDGHVEHTPYEIYYDIGADSISARYWGSFND